MRQFKVNLRSFGGVKSVIAAGLLMLLYQNCGRIKLGENQVIGSSGSAICGSFIDVLGSDAGCASITAVTNAGIMQSCGTDLQGNIEFCPNTPITRQDSAIMVMKAISQSSQCPAVTPYSGTISDISNLSTSDQASVRGFWGIGATTGCGGTNFCPAADVARENEIFFLVKAVSFCGTSLPTPASPVYFTDSTAALLSNQTLANDIQIAYQLNWTTGCNGSLPLFCPTNNMTRWEMAIFIAKSFGLIQ